MSTDTGFHAKVNLAFKVGSDTDVDDSDIVAFLEKLRSMNMLRSWVHSAITAQFKAERAGRSGYVDVALGATPGLASKPVRQQKRVATPAQVIEATDSAPASDLLDQPKPVRASMDSSDVSSGSDFGSSGLHPDQDDQIPASLESASGGVLIENKTELQKRFAVM